MSNGFFVRIYFVVFAYWPSCCKRKVLRKMRIIEVLSALALILTLHIPVIAQELKPRKELSGHSDEIMVLSVRSDGKALASGGADGSILFWDTDDYKIIRSVRAHNPFPTRSIVFSKDGKVLVSCGDDKTIKFWDAANGASIKSIDTSEVITCIRTSPDGKLLACGTMSGNVVFFDMKTRMRIKTLREHKGLVSSLAFDNKGAIMASCSWDRSIKTWDATKILMNKDLALEKRSLLVVRLSPDGKVLASAGDDREIKLRDVSSGKLLLTLKGHGDYVYDISFSSDGKFLASGDADGTLKFWDLTDGKNLASVASAHDRIVRSIEFFPDNKRIITGGGNSVIRLWDVSDWTSRPKTREK